jgi:peptide deformylase
MALRKILTDEDPALHKRCREVTEINDRIRTLIDDMTETMYHANGVGLAAPQVGVLRRVAVVDVGTGLYQLVNPVIVEQSGSACGMEACLSIPDKQGYVLRPERVVVEALDKNGEKIRIEAEGYLAVALCHELDHLDGVVFTDRVIEPTEEQIAEAERRGREALELLGASEDSEGEPESLIAAKPLRGRRNTRKVTIVNSKED